MAPIKFEEKIKDKLEKRSLSPSSDSWSKLSDRLDEDEKKSKKPMYWWLSIAAGLLIMVAVSFQFFNTDESENVLPQIVEEPVIEEPFNNKKNEDVNSIDLVIQENRVEDQLEDKNETLPVINKSEIINYKKSTERKTKKHIRLAEQNNLKDVENLINNKRVNNQATIIEEALINETLTIAIQESKNEQSSVSDREIDSLLKVASKELFKEKLNIETTKTVDAGKLLESVEDEMGQSYRGKVFEALKESYKTVKTAVVNRNN